MSVNAYWAYGLTIHADMLCPELPPHPHPASDPDVVIRVLDREATALCPLPDRHYQVQPGHFRLDVPGVARYSVEGGKRILIEPMADATPERIRLFLLGSTMGALLYQRGLYPLHGSAVETPWGAMIFVGVQGAGKSTLAAEFHRQGYRLLSDDVCVVERASDGVRILPALAQIRLCADAYQRLGTPEGSRFDVDKYVVPMGERYCPDPVPLRAIQVLCDQQALADHDAPRFEPLRGLSKVQCLLENLYRPFYLKGQSTQTEVSRMAGIIAQNAAVVRVSRRRDATVPQDLVRFLELAWADCFEPAPGVEKFDHA